MPDMLCRPFQPWSNRFFRPGLFLLIGMIGAGALLAHQLSDGPKSVVPAAPAPVTDPVVATINGEPVSAAEYRLVMERKVSLVYSYFKEHQNLDDHPGYWSESSGANGPLAKLREMTREELVHIKVCQGLAQTKGVARETSFASFQSDFERENTRRAKAKAEKQVIYGPHQYRETSYYYIRFGDLVFKLKQAMARGAELKVTESEIKKFYEENRSLLGDKSLADARRGIVMFLSTKEAEQELDALYASARVEMNEAMLRSIVPRMDPESQDPAKLTAQQR